MAIFEAAGSIPAQREFLPYGSLGPLCLTLSWSGALLGDLLDVELIIIISTCVRTYLYNYDRQT